MTIPELRRAFEHIEDVIHDCHTSGNTKEETVKHIRKEWMRTFRKELSKASAEKLVMDHTASHRKRATRKRGGATTELGYAPVGYQMRPGDYSYSSQGGMGDYFSKGLSVTVPESGMTAGTWPTPEKSLGSNQFIPMKGGRRGVRRQGGALSWSLLDAAFTRPVGGSSPPGVLFDAQTMFKGQQVGASSNQIDRQPAYQASMSAKPITF